MKILVTGGAGFIGSAVIRHLIGNTTHSVVNVYKLTYAANLHSLDDVASDDRHCFVEADICDLNAIEQILPTISPTP